MARPKIEGPKPQTGDVFALYSKGKPDPHGRRIGIDEVYEDRVTAHTIGGRRETTCISMRTLRPTANGWHLRERDGRPAVYLDGKVILGERVSS
jgi:hypothetical protein